MAGIRGEPFIWTFVSLARQLRCLIWLQPTVERWWDQHKDSIIAPEQTKLNTGRRKETKNM